MRQTNMRNNWDDVKDRIHSLYKLQRRPLLDVMKYMSSNYGFNASLRTYKEKVKEWGYTKNRPRRRPGNRVSLDPHPPLSEASGGTVIPSFSSLNPATGISNNASNFGPYQNNLAQPPPSYDSPGLWNFGTPQDLYPGPMDVGYSARGPPAIPPFSNLAPLSSVRDNTLNIQDGNGRTPLHHAVIEGSFKKVERCLLSGAAVNISDSYGDQPLHLAAARVFPEIVQLLLEYEADIEAKGQGGKSPLHMCLRSTKTLKMLLKWNPVVSSQDRNGDTPLHLAMALSTFGYPPKGSVVEKLIQSGANVNARNLERITPFHIALERPRSTERMFNSWIALFLENGAEVLVPAEDERLPFQIYVGNTGFQSIELAHRDEASPIPTNCFKMFLDKGADINVVLKSGETLINGVLSSLGKHPMHNFRLAQFLCENADLARAGASGDYPLHCALGNSHWRSLIHMAELVEAMLARGADPNQENRAGQSPLILLLSQEPIDSYHIKKVEALLSWGSDPMQRDMSGTLPIYLAMRANRSDKREKMVRLLLKAMASREVSVQPSLSDASDQTDQRWWNIYHLLYQGTTWSDPEDLVILRQNLPPDIADDLWKEALLLLTQKFLQSLKADVESAQATETLDHFTRKSKREELVWILRDSQSLKIDVDPSWYHLLLDLQE